MGVGVSTKPQPLYPWEGPGTYCIGGWVGPRIGLDGCGKSRAPFPPTGTFNNNNNNNNNIYLLRMGCHPVAVIT
jgi:hypothetical protein